MDSNHRSDKQQIYSLSPLATREFPHMKLVPVKENWWGKVDSNHRSDKQQIYSLSPLATREFPHIHFAFCVEPVDGLEPPTC